MTPVEKFVSNLRDVQKTETGYIARCPAHDDENPSLSISVAMMAGR
jgi:DNA primase